MICSQKNELLIDFSLNNLAKSDYDDFANHIRICPKCLDSYLIHKRAVDFASDSIFISNSLERKILSELEFTDKNVQSFWKSNFHIFAIATAILLSISIGIYKLSQDKTSHEDWTTPNVDKNELVLEDFTTT